MNSPATQPQLSLRLPDSFAGLTVSDDADMNAENIDNLAERIASQSNSPKPKVRDNLALTTEFLAAQGARLFGRFCVQDDSPEGPALANLAVGMTPLVQSRDVSSLSTERHSIAQKLQEEFAERNPTSKSVVCDLAIGPAVGVIQEKAVGNPDPRSNAATSPTPVQFEVLYLIPTPDLTHIVTVSVTTDIPSALSSMFNEAAKIADSVRFRQAQTME
jgi:hypothetical protein